MATTFCCQCHRNWDAAEYFPESHTEYRSPPGEQRREVSVGSSEPEDRDPFAFPAEPRQPDPPFRDKRGRLTGGNPGNSGGKKGRSGRPNRKARLRELIEQLRRRQAEMWSRRGDRPPDSPVRPA
jgi:hypothetical protein